MDVEKLKKAITKYRARVNTLAQAGWSTSSKTCDDILEFVEFYEKQARRQSEPQANLEKDIDDPEFRAARIDQQSCFHDGPDGVACTRAKGHTGPHAVHDVTGKPIRMWQE